MNKIEIYLINRLKIKKIRLNKLINSFTPNKYILLQINLTSNIVESKQKQLFIKQNYQSIQTIERFDLKEWINNNLETKKIVVILNKWQHVKYEYRLIRSKQIKCLLIKD